MNQWRIRKSIEIAVWLFFLFCGTFMLADSDNLIWKAVALASMCISTWHIADRWEEFWDEQHDGPDE